MVRISLAFRYLTVLSLMLGLIAVAKYYSSVRWTPAPAGQGLLVNVNFLVPVNREILPPNISVVPEIPGTSVSWKAAWSGPTTLTLELLQEGLPEGQLLLLRVEDVSTRIPFLKKSVTEEFRPRVPVRLVTDAAPGRVPTSGPIPITFNTPLDPQSLRESLILPAPGNLRPSVVVKDGQVYTDHSRWHYIPAVPLRNDKSYRITVTPSLRSKAGVNPESQAQFSFTTAEKPTMLMAAPNDAARGVQLFPAIRCAFDREIGSASIETVCLENNYQVRGITSVRGKEVVFQPSHALLPGVSYRVMVRAKSREGENADRRSWSFATTDMGDKYWVDVKLGDRHTVTIYRGKERIRQMLASGGRAESPTPLGCFYTQNRGYSFWSPRFGEGATYWVQLVGDILIHSVPRDSHWQTKQDEHAKLGLPASHGCVRLAEEDARWFFEHVPRGTLVIIHP